MMKPTTWMTRALSASAVAVGLAFSAASHATVLTSYLTFDGPVHGPVMLPGPVALQGGGEDKLQDDGLAQFIPVTPGLAGYAVGDKIWGVIAITQANASTLPNIAIGATDQISLLFSAEVSSIGMIPSGPVLSLAPGTGLYSIANLCGNLCLNAPGAAGVDADTAAVVLSSNNARAGSDDPMNWAAGAVTTNFNNGSWSWEATMGLLAGTDDFFEFLVGSSPFTGQERGAFTIQAEAFSVEWLPVDVLNFSNVVRRSDATLDIGTVQIASIDEIARGWTYRADNSFFVNPVPEPGTLALVGLALAGLGFGGRKQR